MAKGRYAVIGGATRKVKKRYAVIDGVTRKVKKRYAVVNGVTKLIWSGGVANALVFYGNYYKPGSSAYQYYAHTFMTEDPISGSYTEVKCVPLATSNNATSGVIDIIYANDRYYAVCSSYSKSGIWYSDSAVSAWTGLVTFGSGTETQRSYGNCFSVDNNVYIKLTSKTETSSGSDASGNSGNAGNYYQYYYRLNTDNTTTLYTYTGSYSNSSGSWGSSSGSTGYSKFVKLNNKFYTLKTSYNYSEGQGGANIQYGSILCSTSSIGGTLTEIGSGASLNIAYIEVVDNEIYVFASTGIYKINTSTGVFTAVNTTIQSTKVLKMSENSWLTYTHSSTYGTNRKLTLNHVLYSNGSFTSTSHTITSEPYVTYYSQMCVRDSVVYMPVSHNVSGEAAVALDMYYSLDYGKTWTVNSRVSEYAQTLFSSTLNTIMCSGVQPF